MKRCPTCQRTYTDDSLTFCLEDGAPLLVEASSSAEPPATMILSEPPPTSSDRSSAPTEVYNSNATNATNATPPPNPTKATHGTGSPLYTSPPPTWTPQPSAPQTPSYNQQSWPQSTTNAAPPNKFLPAIIGGVVMILPSLVPAIQFGCCLWAAAGGLLASALYIKKSPTKVEMGEGALLGAIAGGFGGLINLLAGLPLAYALYGPQGPYTSDDGNVSGALIVVGIIGTLMLVTFSILGGLLAVPMFEKRRNTPTMPPPPPAYGGGYR
jgi:hypothetical protein